MITMITKNKVGKDIGIIPYRTSVSTGPEDPLPGYPLLLKLNPLKKSLAAEGVVFRISLRRQRRRATSQRLLLLRSNVLLPL